jgi:hypothetical protein
VADENDKPEVEQEDDLSNLSTKLSPVQFKMDGDDYELRYLTGETLGTYRNKFKDRVRLVNGKPAGLNEYKGLESSLICLCLYRAGQDKPVLQKEIDTWPQPVIDRLFKKVRKMNALEEAEADKEKKA